MKLIFASDLHANVKLPFAKVNAGGVDSDRLRDVLEVMKWIAIGADEGKADGIFILGDLFDQGRPDGPTLIKTSRALREMAEVCPTYILPGNHDAVDRDGETYTLQFYEELKVPNLRVLGHEVVELTEGFRIHAVPWLPEARAAKRIRRLAKDVDGDGFDLLVFHQGVKGAFGDGDWICDDGLDGDLTEGFDMALAGHFHRPQEHDWGAYLGSPLQLKFADVDGELRGFHTLETPAGSYGSPLTFEQTVLGSPQFGQKNIRLDEGHSIDDYFDIDELEGEDFAYFRFVIEGHPDAIAEAEPTLKHWQQSVKRLGLRHLKIDRRRDAIVRERIKVNPDISHEEMVRRYGKKFKGDIERGLQLLGRVK